MKKIFVLVALVFICGCRSFMFSHNANLVGVGKVFKVGAGDYGIMYVNGLVAIEGVRENSEMVVETNDGDSFANPASAVKGVRSIRFRTGPQITGYLVDLAEKDSEAAKAYVKKMPDINKASWDAKQTKPVETTALKSEALSAVAGKAKTLPEPFDCSGDCELTDLWKISSITYQSAVAMKLLTYADDTTKFEGEKTTLKYSLESFLKRMEQLTAKGKTTTCMRVKYAKVEGGRLTDINYVMIEDDGNTFETHCPECVLLEE